MAGDFLRSHGIDIDTEMHRIQHSSSTSIATSKDQDETTVTSSSKIVSIFNVSLPNTPPGSRWIVDFIDNHISLTKPYHTRSDSQTNKSQNRINAHGALLAPSLCHPHVHLDKAYLLSHPKYAHLPIERGDFAEAMELTGKAKAMFEHDDLLERGRRLIDESVAAGVTHMRAFVEVDAGVGLKCLQAGIELKKAAEAAGRCHIQLCVFAQLPLFSPSQDDPEGEVIRGLMEDAAAMSAVDCVGSTPYVEANRELMERNVEWMVELSARRHLHLDFHLDYNLDPEAEPMVWHVITSLKTQNWVQQTSAQRTIVLGHCTRLTLWPEQEWLRLKSSIKGLPISFVGLPTSDLFMMRTLDRKRGTLDIPTLIKTYGFNACIGMNNIGNAFTPHGSCDPLTLACNGVGVYQAGTKRDAEILYECISTRARAAIGLGRRRDGDVSLEVKQGDGDLVLFGAEEEEEWRTRGSVAEAVYLYESCQGRRAFWGGKMTAAGV